eukprot:TRINITY_DN73865_c0_g1_i1.p1 TRINITY_DN73865_c0_g1~~TRINITY_DN73865_c0_g1_i1.p1  ORF type:complete len:235 (-),score=25.16 TRINITY_DN73865_c0_g1_i1:229-864(-)
MAPPTEECVPFPQTLVGSCQQCEGSSSDDVGRDIASFTPDTTTVIVHNLPIRLRKQCVLLEMWPVDVHKYDFVYVPFNPRRRRASGYVFMNFVTPEAAMKFRDAFHGKILDDYKMHPLAVGRAECQGFCAAIMLSWPSMQSCKHAQHFPAAFHDGQPVSYVELALTIEKLTNAQVMIANHQSQMLKTNLTGCTQSVKLEAEDEVEHGTILC